jgi:hypothetical protein
MNKIMIITKVTCIFLWTAGICLASGCPETPNKPQQKNPKDDPVDIVLDKLNKKTSELKSYESQIEYKYLQPLLESETLHKGVIYYARTGKKSALNISFNTRKQDDEKEQKYIERYVVLDGVGLNYKDYEFKGIWLVHLDYQIKDVKYYQLAEPNDPNEPTDVFDLAGKKLPMLGFSKIEDLKKQFDIQLIEPKKAESENLIQVHLKVKPNSIYKDDYKSIDFWIDEKLGLPAKIIAVKSEPEPPYGDIEEIKFLHPKVNKDIDTPAGEQEIESKYGFSSNLVQ